jgi:hypothetical protein
MQTGRYTWQLHMWILLPVKVLDEINRDNVDNVIVGVKKKTEDK